MLRDVHYDHAARTLRAHGGNFAAAKQELRRCRDQNYEGSVSKGFYIAALRALSLMQMDALREEAQQALNR